MSKQCDSTFTNASDYHYMQGYQDGIKQGKTEGIEEYCKKLKEHYGTLSDEMPEAYKNTCKTFDKIAEQLKEQMNE